MLTSRISHRMTKKVFNVHEPFKAVKQFIQQSGVKYILADGKLNETARRNKLVLKNKL